MRLIFIQIKTHGFKFEVFIFVSSDLRSPSVSNVNYTILPCVRGSRLFKEPLTKQNHILIDLNCLTLMPSKNHQLVQGWITPLKWQRSTLEFLAILTLQVCLLIASYLDRILRLHSISSWSIPCQFYCLTGSLVNVSDHHLILLIISDILYLNISLSSITNKMLRGYIYNRCQQIEEKVTRTVVEVRKSRKKGTLKEKPGN